MNEEKAIKRALYITKVADLRYYDGSFHMVYFGNECCQRLIPSVEELQQILDFVLEKNLEFAFVTPYVTDGGLKILDTLFQKVEKEKPGSEVVFNDWGVLHALNQRYHNLEPVMGRLLNKMKRGPRLMNLLDSLPQSTADYFRGSSLDVPLYRQFLIKKRVRRVELDNLLQGIVLNFSAPKLNASLYIPYAYITTTRLCLAISCDVHGKEDEIGIFPCKKECQEYTFQLIHPVMSMPLIRKGNTVFFKNEKMPPEDMIRKNYIDRIVIEPEVPL